MDAFFYDVFAEEYTLKTDPYAPPERYIKVSRGSKDYKEIWLGKYKTKGNKTLTVKFSSEDYYSENHDKLLMEECKKQDFKPEMLIEFYLPKDKFDEYLKQLNQNS